MHTMLFFDDWLLHGHRGLKRLWKQPQPVGAPYCDPAALGYHSVEYNTEARQWRAWGSAPNPERSRRPDEIRDRYLMLMWISENGLEWRRYREDLKSDGDGTKLPHVVFLKGGGSVFRDDRETNPEKRYKMAFNLWAGPAAEGEGYFGERCELCLATSNDGTSWKEQDIIHPLASDSANSITFNPARNRYQITIRASSPDRRVALMESEDFERWSRPLLVLSPDPADPPCVQFYGMPHFIYEGYDIGLLWAFQTQYDEPSFYKREGQVYTQLVYSLNGIAWNRTTRAPFVSSTELNGYSAGQQYGCSLVETPEGDLRVYASTHTRTHGENEDRQMLLAAYRLRRDGFVCLEPEARWGELVTTTIIPEEETLILNARAPRGEVRVEVLDAQEIPISEYCGENAARFTGDETSWHVKWPKACFAELKGRQIKLRIRLTTAELYAIRFEGFFGYSHTAIADLAGTEYGPSLYPDQPETLKPLLDEAWMNRFSLP